MGSTRDETSLRAVNSSASEKEAKRLTVLRSYGLFDKFADESLDRIARMAASLFDVPIVMISLMDENRQWFIARVGLDVCEAPRDSSLCAHVIDSEQMLAVPDTRQHPDFAGHPLVTGAPHIRFYAGAPLQVPQQVPQDATQNVTLGTICLLDMKPREFSDEDREQLADLAAMVVDKMKLRYSERLYRALVESGSELVTIFDIKGEVVYQSPTITRLLGYDVDELDGEGMFNIIHPDDQAIVSTNHARMRATKSDIAHYNFRARNKSGEWRVMECYIRYQMDHPQICGVVSIVRDVTERARIERQLDLSEQRFKVMFEQSSVGTAIVARDSSLVRINRKFAEMTGIDRERCGETLYKDLMHPDELKGALKDRDRLLSGEIKSLVWERHLRCQGGEYRWSLFNISLIRDDEGRPDYFIVQVQDVHERKKQEERLRLLESVAVNSNDAVLITEAEPTGNAKNRPRILYANEAYFRMSGYTLEEITGKTPRIMQGPETDRETCARIRNALERRQPVVAELLNYRKDGSTFWVELSIVPVADETGWYTHWVSTQRDITARKESEAMLMLTTAEADSAREEAEAANAAKSEFLSRMSHELRTPLNAILGFGQLLEMEEQEPHNQESTEQILKAGRHLLELINEVLDISRIETGRMAMSLEAVSVAEVARETLDLVRAMAAQHGVSLRGAALFSSPVSILGDRRRVKQVLLNMVSNAIKYNRAGGCVTLSLENAEDSERVRLCVTDTGIGIAPEKIERLWVPFDRLDAETTGVEGTGIGLALSHRLAQAMNGRLDVRPEVQGSTFWLELPAATSLPLTLSLAGEAERLGITPATSPAVSTRWVALYIDDNLPNVQLVQGILARRPEVRLLTALQGALGIELAQQHCPDVILLDLHLPDINGDEILRRLRADSRTKNVPIVIISADATPGQTERLLRAGANEYLSKPFDIGHFLQVLDSCIAHAADAHAAV